MPGVTTRSSGKKCEALSRQKSWRERDSRGTMGDSLNGVASPGAAERIHRAGRTYERSDVRLPYRQNRNARHVESVFTILQLVAVVALLPERCVNFVSISLWRLKGMQGRTTMFFGRRLTSTWLVCGATHNNHTSFHTQFGNDRPYCPAVVTRIGSASYVKAASPATLCRRCFRLGMVFNPRLDQADPGAAAAGCD